MSDDKTIVISTHQVRDIDKVLDHVLIMDIGNRTFGERCISLAGCESCGD